MPTGLFKTPDQSAQIEYDGVSIPIPRSTYEKNGSKHRRAIVQEIGERLRAFLQEEPEPPESLRTQINRLRELEEQSPSIIRWDKLRC